MAKNTQPESDRARVVRLTGNLDIDQAVNLHQRLQRLLNTPRPVVIDAGKVKNIDAMVLQLLVVFVQYRGERSLDLSWRAVSTSLRMNAEATNLAQHLRLPSGG